jgi:hypothetical protein
MRLGITARQMRRLAPHIPGRSRSNGAIRGHWRFDDSLPEFQDWLRNALGWREVAKANRGKRDMFAPIARAWCKFMADIERGERVDYDDLRNNPRMRIFFEFLNAVAQGRAKEFISARQRAPHHAALRVRNVAERRKASLGNLVELLNLSATPQKKSSRRSKKSQAA